MKMSKKPSAALSIFPAAANELEASYLWEKWILKTTQNPPVIQLLYSWVISSSLIPPSWQAATVLMTDTIDGKDQKTHKIQLIKTALCATGTSIRDYIAGLLEGSFLGEIKVTGTQNHPSTEFMNLRLGPAKADIAARYRIRPEVQLPVEHSMIPWQSKSVPNPTPNSAFVSQLVDLRKLFITELMASSLELEHARALTKKITVAFQKDTNFDLTRASAARIGNIEWYRYPMSDPALLNDPSAPPARRFFHLSAPASKLASAPKRKNPSAKLRGRCAQDWILFFLNPNPLNACEPTVSQ